MEIALKNKFDSIIFDLDGTLWDSTANVAIAWQTTTKQVGYVKEEITAEVVASICGLTYDDIFKKLFPYLTTEQRLNFQSICSKLELEVLRETGGKLYPGLEETLQYLAQKYKLFVVSNCQSGYIEIFLATSKTGQYFSGHQCYGTKSQPKFQNIQDVVNDHQLKAPVYIGDTQGDYNSAAKAGVPFIFAAYGFAGVEGERIADIDSLSELITLL
jgi:phosphoglycolate phosphatase